MTQITWDRSSDSNNGHDHNEEIRSDLSHCGARSDAVWKYIMGSTNGPIERTGTSPRIQKLKQQLADGVQGATDDFWATLAREHALIIEPVPGDSKHVLITLIRRNQPGTKSVQVSGMEMTLLSNTDIWYVTFMMENH